MKTTIASRNPEARLRLIAFLASAVVTSQVAGSHDSIQVIQMESVPLKDAIGNLARQTGQNYILDPRLSGPWIGVDGRSIREPCVTVHWENLHAEQALGRLLKEHGLTMVANPATSIARIAFTNQAVKPLAASAVGNGTNAVMPLITIDSVPLADLIRNLARQAHLQLDLDPALLVPFSGPFGRKISDCAVSVRWEKVTVRQALAALLDNYDLVLVEDPVTSSARVIANAQAERGKPPKLLGTEVSCGPALESPLADFQGRVVDDETGKPVTNFWVQAGAANPLKPEEIIWSQSYRGPVITGPPGRFGVQVGKEGQAWRVLADGYLPQLVTEHPVVAPVRAFDLVVRLKRGGELRGIVRDHAGQPAAGARVFLATEQNLNLTDGNPNDTFRGSTAITDAEGHFALRGVGGKPGVEQKVVVVSADGLPVSVAAKAEPGQEWKITMPEPATLIVRYDIPDDAPQTQLRLQLNKINKPWGMAGLDGASYVRQPTVTNQGQVVLTGLAPGTYDLTRMKMLRVGTVAQGWPLSRSTVVLEAGQPQHVDFVRATGFPVRGQVVGLANTKAPGAFIYVRSAESTSGLRKLEEWALPLFDAVTCDETGDFSTARLEPGTYTIAVEAFIPEPPSLRHRTGIRRPDYIGTAKVTINADTPPARAEIQLSPRPSTQ